MCRSWMCLLFALLVVACAMFAAPVASWADEQVEGAVPSEAANESAAVADGSEDVAANGQDTDAAGKPATEPATTPIAEPAAEPVVEPAAQPAGEADAAPVDPTPAEGEPVPGDAASLDAPDSVTGVADDNSQVEEPVAAAVVPDGLSEEAAVETEEAQAEQASKAVPVPVAAPKKAAGAAASTAKTPVLAAGTYLFTWVKKTKYIAQSAKNSTKAKASVVLGKKSSILRQRWIVKFDEKTGYYTIVNEQTKKVLAISSKKNGSNVIQVKAKAGNKKQLWKVIKKGSNYIFVPKANKKLALTGVKAKGGYNLIVRKLTKSKVQQFAMKSGGIVRNGVYKIALTRKTSKVLGVAGSSKADGASVKRGSYEYAQSQKFRITYRGNDLYTIEALHSGKFVGAKGSAVVQATDSAAAAQRWAVHWNKKGIAFKNAETGLRLNSAGTSAAVTGEKASKTKDQRWKLTKVDPAAMDPIVAKALAKAKKKGSATKYFVAVDIKNHRTIIFKKSGSTWKLSKNWACSTGAAGSPTPTGSWTVGIKGYSFGSGYTCYYYTQFWGDYLFHSVKYYQGTRTVKDGRLGLNISEGCVRLAIKNAKWIYDYIPEGTRVITYK